MLSNRGLRAAVEVLTGRAPIPVEIAEIPDARLPQPVEAAAYYLIAEALTNVTKYAQASTVRLRVAASDANVVIEVSDDGVGGADPGTAPASEVLPIGSSRWGRARRREPCWRRHDFAGRDSCQAVGSGEQERARRAPNNG